MRMCESCPVFLSKRNWVRTSASKNIEKRWSPQPTPGELATPKKFMKCAAQRTFQALSVDSLVSFRFRGRFSNKLQSVAARACSVSRRKGPVSRRSDPVSRRKELSFSALALRVSDVGRLNPATIQKHVFRQRLPQRAWMPALGAQGARARSARTAQDIGCRYVMFLRISASCERANLQYIDQLAPG